MLLLCAGALWLECHHIDQTVPYPQHVDEAFISGPAQRTLLTGTLHPYTFNYPSLPKYLAAAGMAVGFVRGAAHAEISDIHRLGNVGYPYYETRRPMQTARQLFALLSVIALAATGRASWLAFRQPAAVFLAPLILFASPLFFFHSWTYLNVDIVGACFVMLTVVACLEGTRRPSIYQSALVPGALAGLATGSKYTLAFVILPVLLAIGFYLTGARRTRAWLAALAAMVLAFLVAVPYSLIDIPGFLNGVASEAFHYASGHRGFQGSPGLEQLVFYARHFASEFGLATIVAVIGAAGYMVRDWRRAAVLLAFPVAVLWQLSSQRVHFTRNVLSLHPLLAMFAALGVLAVHGWLLELAARRGWTSPARVRRTGAIAALLLTVVVVPFWHIADHLRDRTDSRNLVGAWLAKDIPQDWTVVVPEELGLDTREMEAGGRKIVKVKLQPAADASAQQALLGGVPSPAVILIPHWGADDRFPGQETAPALNALAARWRVMAAFGTNDVLVNYSYPNPWGDPAFVAAVLR